MGRNEIERRSATRRDDRLMEEANGA